MAWTRVIFQASFLIRRCFKLKSNVPKKPRLAQLKRWAAVSLLFVGFVYIFPWLNPVSGTVRYANTGKPVVGAWIKIIHGGKAIERQLGFDGGSRECVSAHVMQTDDAGHYWSPGFPLSMWFTTVNKRTLTIVYFAGYGRTRVKSSLGDIELEPVERSIEDELGEFPTLASGYCGDKKNHDSLGYFKTLYADARATAEKFKQALALNLNTGEMGDLDTNYKALMEADPEQAKRRINDVVNAPRLVCFYAISRFVEDIPEDYCPWLAE